MILDIFLLLLKAGLWHQEVSLPQTLTETEWEQLFQIARKQTLLGIISDGINLLPLEQHPDTETTLSLLQEIISIERDNKLKDMKAMEISSLLQENGIKSVLVKGQGVAREYIKPEHRDSGDIDFYICDGKIEEAIKVVQQLHPIKPVRSLQHYSFLHDDQMIELHRTIIAMPFLPFARRLNKWLVYKLHHTERNFDGIVIPDEEFNVVFEYYHMFMHFMNGGVGLRQICDWCLCLHNAYGKIDSTKLQKELGWEPSLQFEEGIEKTVRWYLDNEAWMDNVTSGEYQKYYDGMYKGR